MSLRQIWNKFGLWICLAGGLIFTTIATTKVDMIITLLWAVGMVAWIVLKVRRNRAIRKEGKEVSEQTS